MSSWAWGAEAELQSEPPPATGQPQDLCSKASSWQGKQEEHRRERNVNSNGELCLWSVENMQSSDLPFEAASQRVLFNDVAIPGGPAACPLAIDSFPGSSEGVMGSGRTAGLWISLRNQSQP